MYLLLQSVARNRENSHLLNLPIEVRNMIFSCTLMISSIQLSLYYGDLLEWKPKVCVWSLPGGPRNKGSPPDDPSSIFYVSPFLIYRQIYDETRLLVYSLKTFAFWDSIDLKLWVTNRIAIQCAPIFKMKLPSGTASHYVERQSFVLKDKFPILETLFLPDMLMLYRAGFWPACRELYFSMQSFSDAILSTQGSCNPWQFVRSRLSLLQHSSQWAAPRSFPVQFLVTVCHDVCLSPLPSSSGCLISSYLITRLFVSCAP
jgi:hypothetical protein